MCRDYWLNAGNMRALTLFKKQAVSTGTVLSARSPPATTKWPILRRSCLCLRILLCFRTKKSLFGHSATTIGQLGPSGVSERRRGYLGQSCSQIKYISCVIGSHGVRSTSVLLLFRHPVLRSPDAPTVLTLNGEVSAKALMLRPMFN